MTEKRQTKKKNGKEELATIPAIDDATLETVLLDGDLSKLSRTERTAYFLKICHSLGLNPSTLPFDYLRLNGKVVLYAKKNCTEQLRKLHGVSIRITDRKIAMDMIIVTAQATDAQGRVDESVGVVPANCKGADLANAFMKCETKAKRRVTLSICGLGMIDESEIHTIAGAEIVKFDDDVLGEAVDQSSQFQAEDESQDEELVTERAASSSAPGYGERLRGLGLSQGSIADALKISIKDVSQVQYGQQPPFMPEQHAKISFLLGETESEAERLTNELNMLAEDAMMQGGE